MKREQHGKYLTIADLKRLDAVTARLVAALNDKPFSEYHILFEVKNAAAIINEIVADVCLKQIDA